MKLTKLMMTAAVAVVIAAPAMAQDVSTTPSTTNPVDSTTTTTTTSDTTTSHKTTHPHHMAHHHHHGMAQAGGPPMPFFDKLDTNHDGVITKDEWDADADKKFAEIDANHDGKITRAEMAKFHHDMMENHPEWAHHHMPPPPPGDQSWNHHTMWVQHSEYYSDNRPNIGAPTGSTSVPPANNEVDPNNRRPEGADGAGGWTAQ